MANMIKTADERFYDAADLVKQDEEWIKIPGSEHKWFSPFARVGCLEN